MDRPLGTLMRLHLLLSLCTCSNLLLPIQGSPVLQGELEVMTVVGEDCVLRCMAPSKPGVQYRSLTWYKGSSGNSSGLLTKKLQEGKTLRHTDAEQAAELLEDSYDIVLYNVTCGDSGLYRCHLSAPVGERNQEGHIYLILTDCPTGSSETVGKEAGMVIIATAILMLALMIYMISYVILRNTMRGREKETVKETFLDGMPDKEDLKLIYTLGPKPLKTATTKQVFV